MRRKIRFRSHRSGLSTGRGGASLNAAAATLGVLLLSALMFFATSGAFF